MCSKISTAVYTLQRKNQQKFKLSFVSKLSFFYFICTQEETAEKYLFNNRKNKKILTFEIHLFLNSFLKI